MKREGIDLQHVPLQGTSLGHPERSGGRQGDVEFGMMGGEMVLSFKAPVLIVFFPHVSVVFGVAVFEGCEAGDDVQVDRD